MAYVEKKKKSLADVVPVVVVVVTPVAREKAMETVMMIALAFVVVMMPRLEDLPLSASPSCCP